MMPDVSESAKGGGEDSKLAEISQKLETLQASITSLGERIDLPDGRKVLNVDHTLGVLEASVTSLERARASQGERIEELLQWVSNVPNLEKNVEKIMTDLNQLGQKRVAKLEAHADTAKMLGWVAISVTGAAVTLLVYFLRFLEAHVVFKP
jgi:hypothetical protein